MLQTRKETNVRHENREKIQRHTTKTETLKYTGGEKDTNRQETDSESTVKRAALWQTQTFHLKNGTICLCLAPVHHIGSEIEKRKTAQARPKKGTSSTHPPSVPRKSLLPPTQRS